MQGKGAFILEDIISAVATAHGRGGVAVIRMSGAGALALAEKMFTPTGKTPVSAFEPYKMYAGNIAGEGLTDFGLCVFFRAPKSYTGEDTIEFHCHGGENIARAVLQKTFSLGARIAQKGEFTKRAFLNGKLSLSSAEGVADMINAESQAEARAGYLLYSEKLTDAVRGVQERLKTALAQVDVFIDYPEESADDSEVEIGELKRTLQGASNALLDLLQGYETGKKIKSGVTVAICGKPNTGKSSLLNRLLGYDKAIVSELAGTTRDAVEGSLEIKGKKFNLYDTAGVREGGDRIENIGIERAEALIKSADLAVFVADIAGGVDEEDARVLEMLKGKPVIKVFNKTDLISDDTQTDADVHTSAVTGEGILKLKELLYEKGFGESLHEAFLIEERHYTAMRRAQKSIERAVCATDSETLDLVAIDIKEAWDALGEVTGETATEAIIEEIFSKFCVGK